MNNLNQLTGTHQSAAYAVSHWPTQVDDLLRWGKAHYPQKTAVKDGKHAFSYRQLDSEVNRKAWQFDKIGIKQGDKVLIQCQNKCEFVIGLFAALRVGAVVIPLYYNSTSRELKEITYTLDIKAVLTDQDKYSSQKKLLHQLVDAIIVFGTSETDTSSCSVFTIGKETQDSDITKFPTQAIDVDPALIIFTSSSTGKPKGIQLSHRNILTNCISNVKSIGLCDTDRTLIYLPFSYLYSLSHQLFSTLLVGGTAIIAEDLYLPHLFLKNVARHDATFFAGTPFMYYSILRYLDNTDSAPIKDFLRMATIGGSKISVSAVKKLRAYFPDTDIKITYGLTENAPRVSTLPHSAREKHLNSVGYPLPNVEVKIYPTDKEYHELAVRGSSVMMGYHTYEGNYIATNNNEFKTGDLGYFNEEGMLVIAGRSKQVVKHKGYRVYPAEVESVLNEHSQIVQARVYGIDCEISGQVLCADIIPLKNEQLDPITLRNYCSKYLSEYKIPDKINIKDAFSLNRNFKIVKTPSHAQQQL